MIVPATLKLELSAWGFTRSYLLCWAIVAHPSGAWKCYHEGELIGSGDFRRAIRGPWQGFIHRDLLRSRQAKMGRGLLFRFRHAAESRFAQMAARAPKGNSAMAETSPGISAR